MTLSNHDIVGFEIEGQKGRNEVATEFFGTAAMVILSTALAMACSGRDAPDSRGLGGDRLD